MDVELSQLEKRWPAALPTGTRPVAIPPTSVPRAKGVRIEENEKTVSITPSSRGVEAPARSAYAAPRKTMPMPARKSGIASVEAIDPNAVG
jgi:hypothetical protein